jgi:hypothetical protein
MATSSSARILVIITIIVAIVIAAVRLFSRTNKKAARRW